MKDELDNVVILDDEIYTILLIDRTTNKKIIWATTDYSSLGNNYKFNSHIMVEFVTQKNSLIKSRVEKSKNEQIQRSKNNAEVFTPSWVCNIQNNLIDKTMLGCKFNIERYSETRGHRWEYSSKKIEFPRPSGVTWQEYVEATRLEISCGEAPYITSRYDTVSGKKIKTKQRIGILDRKLRIIGENVTDEKMWLEWAEKALKSIYGYEFQGDNLFIARKNILFTVIEHYYAKYGEYIPYNKIRDYAYIISWNIWQMDGLRYVIPHSCHEEEYIESQLSLFDDQFKKKRRCIGCENNDRYRHNGIYCNIMDWNQNKTLKFIELFGAMKYEL